MKLHAIAKITKLIALKWNESLLMTIYCNVLRCSSLKYN